MSAVSVYLFSILLCSSYRIKWRVSCTKLLMKQGKHTTVEVYIVYVLINSLYWYVSGMLCLICLICLSTVWN